MSSSVSGRVERITVSAERRYDVVVGRHLLGELPGLLGSSVRKVLLVHPGALEASAEAVREDLVAQGYEVLLAVIPEAEEAKSIQVVAFAWQILGQSDFTRSDAIVSLGGGATTDVAGFIAATWLRGFRLCIFRRRCWRWWMRLWVVRRG